MTQFNDLVNRAWMHARIGPSYLAGYSPYGDKTAILADEPTAFNEAFIERAEAVTGLVFERILLSEREQLEHEFAAVASAYRRVENKNYWTDDDRRLWRDLGMRYTDLRKAIAQMDEDDGQFGVGA